MADAGFFRGTSAEQDNRFADKEKKLLKALKFDPILDTKVHMRNVEIKVIIPWITKRVVQLLGNEDDVLISYIVNLLEDTTKELDPKKIQLAVTPFLNAKAAREFMRDLWELLVSAQESGHRVPASMMQAKMAELAQQQAEKERIASGISKTQARESEVSIADATTSLLKDALAVHGHDYRRYDSNANSGNQSRDDGGRRRSPQRQRSPQRERSPQRQRSPVRQRTPPRQRSPAPRRRSRSPDTRRRRSRSPRRSDSPPARRRRSPSRSRSPSASPPRRRSPSPRYRKRSPSPAPRKRSPSTGDSRSPSPRKVKKEKKQKKDKKAKKEKKSKKTKRTSDDEESDRGSRSPRSPRTTEQETSLRAKLLQSVQYTDD